MDPRSPLEAGMFAVDGLEKGGLPQCLRFTSVRKAASEAVVPSEKWVLNRKSTEMAALVALEKVG